MAKMNLGDKHGLLTAIGREKLHGVWAWRFKCDCGGEKVALASNVYSGSTKSCGCLVAAGKPKHGFFSRGKTPPPEYQTWIGMKARCFKKTDRCFPAYGGRGISVCPEWRNDFGAFYRDVGPRPSPNHSLDRINNDGDYEPGNCRWATRREQQRNTRRNRRVTINGVSMTAAEIAAISGVSKQAISLRMKAGWSAEQLLLPRVSRRP